MGDRTQGALERVGAVYAHYTGGAGALAAGHSAIPVAHVEAGLRSGDPAEPFPEEHNRRLIAQLASLHFAPTRAARANLLEEGIDPGRIRITGNTAVDAVELIRPRLASVRLPLRPDRARRLVLVTVHRRENLGERLEGVCSAIRSLAQSERRLQFVFIRHPNPRAGAVAAQLLGHLSHIRICNPLPYRHMLALLAAAWLLLTDSGGLQEEAASFRLPVLVLRDRTERTEGLRLGIARLVGAEPNRIVESIKRLLEEPSAYRRMQARSNPYGDGRAATRIARELVELVARPAVAQAVTPKKSA